jgi:hypothetical protein
MKPKKHFETPDLFRARLDQILDHSHQIFILANQIDWSVFAEAFGRTYTDMTGKPGCPTRLMVGLHYRAWLENKILESSKLMTDYMNWCKPGCIKLFFIIAIS